VEHPPDRLRAVEFLPFKAAIEAGVAFIMTAHVLVTSIDDERPATLSPAIVQRILREELGFNGVIVSDDLEMKAITTTYAAGDAAVAAVAAGCDAVLMCGVGDRAHIELQAQVLEALIHAVEDERLSIKQVEAALARNQRTKERFLREWRPPTAAQLKGVIGSDKHRAISEQMASFA
jgi:beta-N-acetylhexosaminidase